MQNIPYDTGKPNRTKNLLIRIKGVVGDQGASAANAKYECCPIEEQEHSLQSLNLEDVAIEKIALVIGEYLPDESSGFVANGVKLKQPDAFDPETDNYHPTQERSAILVATIKDENKFYFYSEFLQNVTEDVCYKQVRYDLISDTIKAKVDGIFAACQQGTIIPNSTALQKKTFNDLIFLGDPVKWLISRVQLGIAADSVKIFQLLLNGQLDDEEDAEDLELWDHDCPTQAVLALSQSIGDNALQGMVIDVCLSRALIYQFCESYKLLEEAGIVDVDYRKLARRAYELAQRVVGNPLPVPDDASFDATEYSAARFLDLFIDIKRETLKAVDDLMKCNGERMPDVTLPDADMTKLLSNAMEAGDHHKRMDAIKNILALAMIEHESSLELIQKLDGQELDAMIKMRDALGDCDEDEDDQ
ncbi:unnamed protein product [Fusarium graminearum]|uniref:Chromosome 1, complete genome n=1 Tax=Gibberella zeae (strain ATCC MYA-4620 / CBS 123657 / FGSC 9075 / NRRL 31084 / PH-1) TaxID=229533 RepID=I1RBK3_GIBZE|nr:hypothetical protein FGSG_00928 [Fusarium graminearum PH-1]ESU06184.1 hypothetical protein FGSG_00928 [Fusarium graminearum PH-1]CEF72971.1 unnamed protein product [Fusarium graminearum]CZS76238.1 unnamed protein product [Fusarium graminearum]|eukprot:XP_011316669.1 hypothetical protein FGSG_00928 [Fusarium graminearum PH-1]